MGILMTKNSGMIIGPISTVLGYVMNGIFMVLDKIGIPNIGISIIIFTIVIYLCLLPLTIRQQKFSKLSAKMNPELQAIQQKYKDKKDQDSMLRMNEETKAVYKKYGVSPSGSCVQLVIQLPIMWALYRVIYNFPAYVPSVKAVFSDVVNQLTTQENYEKAATLLQGFKNAAQYAKQFSNESFTVSSEYMKNTFIDVLNKASTAEWGNLKDAFPSLASSIDSTYSILEKYNSFLGLNIANSPSYVIKDAFSNHHYGLMIGAVMVPVLAALTQFLNIKLMPQPNTGGNEQADAMAASMKSMNMMMPLMSAFFGLTLPIGLGIYWITGAVVRSIQQVGINRHIDTIDFDKMIAENEAKEKERAAKAKEKDKNRVAASTVNHSAKLNTKALSSSSISEKEREEMINKAKNRQAKPGSMAAKVNMVRDYNMNQGIDPDQEEEKDTKDTKDNQKKTKNKKNK